jgi:hypothetical protein
MGCRPAYLKKEGLVGVGHKILDEGHCHVPEVGRKDGLLHDLENSQRHLE